MSPSLGTPQGSFKCKRRYLYAPVVASSACRHAVCKYKPSPADRWRKTNVTVLLLRCRWQLERWFSVAKAMTSLWRQALGPFGVLVDDRKALPKATILASGVCISRLQLSNLLSGCHDVNLWLNSKMFHNWLILWWAVTKFRCKPSRYQQERHPIPRLIGSQMFYKATNFGLIKTSRWL